MSIGIMRSAGAARERNGRGMRIGKSAGGQGHLSASVYCKDCDMMVELGTNDCPHAMDWMRYGTLDDKWSLGWARAREEGDVSAQRCCNRCSAPIAWDHPTGLCDNCRMAYEAPAHREQKEGRGRMTFEQDWLKHLEECDRHIFGVNEKAAAQWGWNAALASLTGQEGPLSEGDLVTPIAQLTNSNGSLIRARVGEALRVVRISPLDGFVTVGNLDTQQEFATEQDNLIRLIPAKTGQEEGQRELQIARSLLAEVRGCETGHDEQGHAYLKVPARSILDLGARISDWLETEPLATQAQETPLRKAAQLIIEDLLKYQGEVCIICGNEPNGEHEPFCGFAELRKSL